MSGRRCDTHRIWSNLGLFRSRSSPQGNQSVTYLIARRELFSRRSESDPDFGHRALKSPRVGIPWAGFDSDFMQGVWKNWTLVFESLTYTVSFINFL